MSSDAALEIGNEDTMMKLSFIEDLKRMGINKFVDLPQLVVIGDQSSGKSSVLQAITRLPFPIDEGLCTLFPTEVSMQRAPERSLKISITAPIRAFDALHADKSMRREADAQNKRIEKFNTTDHSGSPTFADIIKLASDAIVGPPKGGDASKAETTPKARRASQRGNEAKNKNLLSDATLKIVRRGPEEVNLTIVDIPGLVANGHPAHRMARDLVDNYIRNPRSIVLAVAHPNNRETQDIFNIIDTIFDWQNRVIGVITKCDRIDMKGDDWVFEALRNDKEFEQHLSYGWFALRNLSPTDRAFCREQRKDEIETRDSEERRLFSSADWQALNRPHHLGIQNLRSALTKMHNEHVTHSIPELIPEMELRLAEYRRRLEGLGNPRVTPQEQINTLVNFGTQYTMWATDAIDGHFDRLPSLLGGVRGASAELKIRKIVRDALEDFKEGMRRDFSIRFNCESPEFSLSSATDDTTWERDILRNRFYSEIQDCIKQSRGREQFDEVNTAVLRGLWGEQTPRWESRAKQLIETLVERIDRAVGCLLQHACAEEALRINLKEWLDNDTANIKTAALAELQKLLQDEKSGLILTLNDWNLKLFQDAQTRRINHMLETLQRLRASDQELVKAKIRHYLGTHKNVEAIFNTHDKLASYYETGMLRFIDNVCHQVCERHLLGAQSPLRVFAPDVVMKRFRSDTEGLRKIAGEGEKQLRERETLQANEHALTQAISRARMHGLSGPAM